MPLPTRPTRYPCASSVTEPPLYVPTGELLCSRPHPAVRHQPRPRIADGSGTGACAPRHVNVPSSSLRPWCRSPRSLRTEHRRPAPTGAPPSLSGGPMRDAVADPGSHEPREFKKTPRKAAASGWMGSALEYYDFFIYAQAAALVFPTVFFAEGDPQTAIAQSLATFGAGYVARPIGAFVLGHWGDTHGRKNVLVLCMLLMGASTFAVALLPTYQQVGSLAAFLLVVLRLVQGFAVGGEISGASAMIVEHSPFGRRGYYASYSLQGVQAGQILAAAVFLPLSAILPEDQFLSWGWRIPFLLSALVVFAGYVIRRRVDETPAFQEEAVHGEVPKAPIVQAVRENGSDMLRVVCMALMNAIPVATTVFGATYATNDAYGVGMSKTSYLWISIVGNGVAIALIPFVGNLSDRIGRRPLIIFGALASGAMSYVY